MATTTRMKPSTIADKVLDAVWDGQFPVDPVALAEGIVCYRGSNDNRRQYKVVIEPREAHIMGQSSGFASFVGGSNPHFLCGYIGI